MKIKEFIEYINNSIQKLNNDLLALSNFHLQTDNEFKNLREEYIAIKSYIEHHHIDYTSDILLGKETEKWDAKIKFNKKEIILEVTQALPSNEHLTRKSLSLNMYGYKSFSLKLRTLHQMGLDEFPTKILKIINKKHAKKYNDNRILLVVVLFEFAYEENEIFQYWLSEITKRSKKGTFQEIWLLANAEQLFKLH